MEKSELANRNRGTVSPQNCRIYTTALNIHIISFSFRRENFPYALCKTYFDKCQNGMRVNRAAQKLATTGLKYCTGPGNDSCLVCGCSDRQPSERRALDVYGCVGRCTKMWMNVPENRWRVFPTFSRVLTIL